MPTHPQQILDDGFPVASYFSAHCGVMQPLQFLDHGKPIEIHPHCHVMVNESNAHLAVALAGIGLVHTLDFMVRPVVERGDLVVILDAWRPSPLDVYISDARSRQLSTNDETGASARACKFKIFATSMVRCDSDLKRANRVIVDIALFAGHDRNADVIVASGTPITATLQRETGAIPIVFTGVYDPSVQALSPAWRDWGAT